MLRRYVHGPGTDEPLVWYEGTGISDRRFYHADERGSVVATSNGSGAALGYNAYDEYGIPGSGNSGRFQYTGQQWLGDIGMYHYRARIYSPTLGRFMQTDPIGFEGGINLYGYVLNDPVNFVDPFGLSPGDCRDYEVWMYRIVYQVWSPGGVGPGKIVEKYPETRQVCDSPRTNGPSGPGDGGGDGGGQVILVTAQRPQRNCSRSAPNSSFNMEGRVTVGPLMGLGIVPIRYGVSQVRVVTYGPPPGAVSSDNLLQTILGLQGSVTLQFSNSNRIPVNILQQRDVFVTRSGPPRVTQLAVPPGTSHVFVIGTNTTPPRTIVTIYGC